MPKANASKRNANWALWLLAMLVLLALGGFAYVILNQLNSDTGNVQVTDVRESDSDTGQSGTPISILPEQPAGVTVIEKQPETGAGNSQASISAPTAPIAQGANLARGFAMDLGAADAFLELSQRFANIAEVNGQENFVRLEPRAVLRDTLSGLEARLLVGPFETENAAGEACSVLILDPEIECSVAPFEGELIPRQ